MRTYGKYLIFTFFWGLLSGILVFVRNIEIFDLAELFVMFEYGAIGKNPSDDIQAEEILMCMEDLIPVILFVIVFGTYMYRHFTTVYVYYFSRCVNKTKWILKEILYIFLYAVGSYTSLLLGKVILPATRGLNIHIEFIMLFLCGAVTAALLMTMLALIANVIALYTDSRTGAFVSCAILTVSMISFIFIGKTPLSGSKLFLFKLNPCMHLIAGWHSSKDVLVKYLNHGEIEFPYWNSFVYMALLLLIITGISVYVINHKDFFSTGTEGNE